MLDQFGRKLAHPVFVGIHNTLERFCKRGVQKLTQPVGLKIGSELDTALLAFETEDICKSDERISFASSDTFLGECAGKSDLCTRFLDDDISTHLKKII